jgi:hypothetical protein
MAVLSSQMRLRAIQVESYAGSKADEAPRRFCLDGIWTEVVDIIDRWHQVESLPEWPRADYFKVVNLQGNVGTRDGRTADRHNRDSPSHDRRLAQDRSEGHRKPLLAVSHKTTRRRVKLRKSPCFAFSYVLRGTLWRFGRRPRRSWNGRRACRRDRSRTSRGWRGYGTND